MEKEEKLFSSQRGITLIALIITIIVLLILAGITISLVVGDNGVLNQSTKAVERTSHGQVQEQVQMELTNYEADKRTGSEKAIDKTSIEYLVEDGYLTEVEGEEYYIVSPDKTNGANLGKGTSKETGDVYVVEEGDDGNWSLKYYKESNDEEPESLFSFKDSGEEKKLAEKVGDLKVGDHINYVDSNGEEIPCVVLYDVDDAEITGCSDGIQIVTEKCVNDSVGGTGYYGIYYAIKKEAEKYKNENLCCSTEVRVVGTDPKTGVENQYYQDLLENGEFYDEDFNEVKNDDWERLKGESIGQDYWLLVPILKQGECTHNDLCIVKKDGHLSEVGTGEEEWVTDGEGNSYPTLIEDELKSGLRLIFTIKNDLKLSGKEGGYYKIENPVE